MSSSHVASSSGAAGAASVPIQHSDTFIDADVVVNDVVGNGNGNGDGAVGPLAALFSQLDAAATTTHTTAPNTTAPDATPVPVRKPQALRVDCRLRYHG